MIKRFAATFLVLLLLSAVIFVTFPLPGTIPVLMYHFIGTDAQAKDEGNYVSREKFAMQMHFLRKLGYRVISMQDYEEIITGRRKPRGREVVLTFDDGHISFEQEAFPVLSAYQFPSTVFLISDKVKNPDGNSMNLETIKKLIRSGLMTPGAHTQSHPFLTEISEEAAREEIAGSKRDLELMLNQTVPYFAYTYGKFDLREKKMAQEAGYRLAFTAAYKRLQGRPEDLYSLTRIKINRISDNPFIFWYHISGIHQYIKRTRSKLKGFGI